MLLLLVRGKYHEIELNVFWPLQPLAIKNFALKNVGFNIVHVSISMMRLHRVIYNCRNFLSIKSSPYSQSLDYLNRLTATLFKLAFRIKTTDVIYQCAQR